MESEAVYDADTPNHWKLGLFVVTGIALAFGCLAWLGAKGAAHPATKRSTYGWLRLEVMTALVSAVALIVIAVFILIEAYDRWINPQEITQPIVFLSVAVVGLVGNLVSVWLLHSEREHSLNMKAAFLHMVYDAVSSVGVIIGGVVILLYGWIAIDAILSALIAVMIAYSSYQVIKEAVLVLGEAVPDSVDFDRVLAEVSSVPRVRGAHHLHIWSLSSSEIALSCHVCLDEKDFAHGPEVIGRINAMLHDKFEIGHATIQIEMDVCAGTGHNCSGQESLRS